MTGCMERARALHAGNHRSSGTDAAATAYGVARDEDDDALAVVVEGEESDVSPPAKEGRRKHTNSNSSDSSSSGASRDGAPVFAADGSVGGSAERGVGGSEGAFPPFRIESWGRDPEIAEMAAAPATTAAATGGGGGDARRPSHRSSSGTSGSSGDDSLSSSGGADGRPLSEVSFAESTAAGGGASSAPSSRRGIRPPPLNLGLLLSVSDSAEASAVPVKVLSVALALQTAQTGRNIINNPLPPGRPPAAASRGPSRHSSSRAAAGLTDDCGSALIAPVPWAAPNSPSVAGAYPMSARTLDATTGADTTVVSFQAHPPGLCASDTPREAASRISHSRASIESAGGSGAAGSVRDQQLMMSYRSPRAATTAAASGDGDFRLSQQPYSAMRHSDASAAAAEVAAVYYDGRVSRGGSEPAVSPGRTPPPVGAPATAATPSSGVKRGDALLQEGARAPSRAIRAAPPPPGTPPAAPWYAAATAADPAAAAAGVLAAAAGVRVTTAGEGAKRGATPPPLQALLLQQRAPTIGGGAELRPMSRQVRTPRAAYRARWRLDCRWSHDAPRNRRVQLNISLMSSSYVFFARPLSQELVAAIRGATPVMRSAQPAVAVPIPEHGQEEKHDEEQQQRQGGPTNTTTATPRKQRRQPLYLTPRAGAGAGGDPAAYAGALLRAVNARAAEDEHRARDEAEEAQRVARAALQRFRATFRVVVNEQAAGLRVRGEI